MAQRGWLPGKQRTRAHVVADRSVNHVERFTIDEGHTAHRLASDYGYDMAMYTFDRHGYAEPGAAYLQLNASDQLVALGEEYVYDIDVRDYNLWLRELSPVFFVLYDATRRRAFWAHVQDYFRSPGARGPRQGAKTVRLRVPLTSTVSRRAVRKMRKLKQQALGPARGLIPHA